MPGPLLTLKVHDVLRAAAKAGPAATACSLDLDRSMTVVDAGADEWTWEGRRFPYLEDGRERTVYHWVDDGFEPIARFSTSLIKLIPTEWGPPTFEIDGIKMLPTAQVSPYADARRKVGLIQPRGKVILDTCGGLGYFAAWCVLGLAKEVISYEKNADVIWLRALNPWSPGAGPGLTLTHGDVLEHIGTLRESSIDAVLHDPPRFGIAGDLYSQGFYRELARVLRRRGRLFHYTGAPNQVSAGRKLSQEVATRLRRAGFDAESSGDGVLAVRR